MGRETRCADESLSSGSARVQMGEMAGSVVEGGHPLIASYKMASKCQVCLNLTQVSSFYFYFGIPSGL